MSIRSPLFGRRIHIAGSIHADPEVAQLNIIKWARDYISGLVQELMKKGATFVVPVDAEKKRDDGAPLCFDWLIWQTIRQNFLKRPKGAPDPVAIAIQHHKSEDQIPDEMHELWDELRSSKQVQIENASGWNMNSKRMEMAAAHGEILITLGGGEGVLYLANLYHQAGKPVIPLGFNLCQIHCGSRKLFSIAITSSESARFISTNGEEQASTLMNRLNFVARQPLESNISNTISVLESIRPPTVFAVRLLNPDSANYSEVDNYFTSVVKHVVENDLGYTLKTVDGRQRIDSPTIEAEIFKQLHHSAVVVADLTDSRPNCFIELGYALGRSVPVMMTAKNGTTFPFDVNTLPGLIWDSQSNHEELRRRFREYWAANIHRPPLINAATLVP